MWLNEKNPQFSWIFFKTIFFFCIKEPSSSNVPFSSKNKKKLKNEIFLENGKIEVLKFIKIMRTGDIFQLGFANYLSNRVSINFK